MFFDISVLKKSKIVAAGVISSPPGTALGGSRNARLLVVFEICNFLFAFEKVRNIKILDGGGIQPPARRALGRSGNASLLVFFNI